MNTELKTIIDSSKKIIIKKTHIIIFLKKTRNSGACAGTVLSSLKSLTTGLVLILQKNKKIQNPLEARYPCIGIIIIGGTEQIQSELMKETFLFLPSEIKKLSKEDAFLYAHLLVEKNKDFKISYKGEILNTKKFLYGE